ncbi:MAG: hypothetical protein GY803_27590 [Chloroflexi bacterium]|nr:hypothetical protein [Chloroflexota bacterium]
MQDNRDYSAVAARLHPRNDSAQASAACPSPIFGNSYTVVLAVLSGVGDNQVAVDSL